jgi:hypothetical protein
MLAGRQKASNPFHEVCYERAQHLEHHLPSESQTMYMLQRYRHDKITQVFKNACNSNMKQAKY